jgi:hypothetical protein
VSVSTDDDAEYPYMIEPVGGEPVALRPDGCPNCSNELVTIYEQKCWKCDATFTPIRPIGDDVDSTTND